LDTRVDIPDPQVCEQALHSELWSMQFEPRLVWYPGSAGNVWSILEAAIPKTI